jgi:hypothetical protein
MSEELDKVNIFIVSAASAGTNVNPQLRAEDETTSWLLGFVTQRNGRWRLPGAMKTLVGAL